MKELALLGDKAWSFAAQHGPRVLTIVALATALALLIRAGRRLFVRRYLADRPELSERVKRADTLGRILEACGLALVAAMAAMMLIGEAGIDVKPVLASLGIGGLAVGFGAQSLVKDLISGFFILLEDQVRVGDVVEAGGKSGTVERVGLRVLVLRDLAGARVIIPNSQVGVVTNMTYEYSRAVMDVAVEYDSDWRRVEKILAAAGEEMRRDSGLKDACLEPLEIVGIDRFEGSAAVFQARMKTRPGRQWEVAREFMGRVAAGLKAAGIGRPVPAVRVVEAEVPGPGATSSGS